MHNKQLLYMSLLPLMTGCSTNYQFNEEQKKYIAPIETLKKQGSRYRTLNDIMSDSIGMTLPELKNHMVNNGANLNKLEKSLTAEKYGLDYQVISWPSQIAKSDCKEVFVFNKNKITSWLFDETCYHIMNTQRSDIYDTRFIGSFLGAITFADKGSRLEWSIIVSGTMPNKTPVPAPGEWRTKTLSDVLARHIGDKKSVVVKQRGKPTRTESLGKRITSLTWSEPWKVDNATHYGEGTCHMTITFDVNNYAVGWAQSGCNYVSFGKIPVAIPLGG